MDQLEITARAVRGHRNRLKELAERERELKATPWWDIPERLSLRGSISILRGELGDDERKITPENLQQLAKYAGACLWTEAATIMIPLKNPFGPAAREHFDAILRVSLDNLDGLQLPLGRRPIPLADLPELAAVLTPSFVESNAQRVIGEKRALAESAEYLYERSEDDGKPAMTIQHRASGLRARFTLTDAGFGTIQSKPYAIDSIDPEKPGRLDWWEPYVGLGIGEGIYNEAHRRAPEIRWTTSTLSDFSRGLRKKLHASNPYIWASHCGWCDRNLPHGWKQATPSSFAGHP